jgi:hypothetical protein
VTRAILLLALALIVISGLPSLASVQFTGITSTGDVQALSPAFPPSVGNKPAVFAWALFGHLALTLLSMSILARLVNRMRADAYPARHMVTYMRVASVTTMLTVALMAAPDTLLLLLWGEVTSDTIDGVTLLDKVFDGLAAVPFVAGLLYPMAAKRLPQPGLIELRGGGMGDLRQPWASFRSPVLLILTCALASASVAGAKWFLWLS